MIKKYKWLGLVALVIAIFGSVFFSSEETYAALSSQAENLLKKSYANSLKICYSNGTMKDKVTIEPNGAGQIIGSDPIGSNKFFLNNGGTGQIYEYTSAGNGERVNCSTFLEFGNDNSIFDKFGKTGLSQSMSKAAAGTFLENMGYNKINYSNGDPGKTYDNFCLVIKGIGELCWDNEDAVFPAARPTSSTIDKNGYRYIVEDYGESAGIRISKGDFTCKIEMPIGPLKNFQNTRCGNVTGPSVEKKIQKGTTNVGGNYKLVNRNAYSKARSWLAGSGEQEPFSDQEIHDLYMAYLNDVGVSVNIENCADEKPSSGNVIYQLMDDKKTFKWCTVDTGSANPNWRFPGFVIDGKSDSSQRYVFDRLMNIQQLLSAISQWNQLHPEAAIAATKNVNKNDTNNGGSDLCYETAGAMGWILCPAIAATTGIGQIMWDQVQNFLQFKVSVLDEGEGAIEGWKAMRDIANTIFVILFIFVIFSQLTGLGIDNYGIKKILPKLIVIAILINLSFVLCKVFIDLSNILGVGLENLLKGITPPMPDVAQQDGFTSSFIGGATGVALAGIAIASIYSAFQKAGTLKGFAGAIAIGILGAAIVVVVGILVVFLILTIRTAGIVILTVVSPIAIVCYALPNTEKISKKWMDLFKALLVVYPICGAMVGAGEFAKSVLYSITPMFALIASVVPYFFIPFILKNSLNAMGNLGGKISSLGRTFGKRGSGAATGAIKNSERYKDFQQYHSNLAARRRAQGISDRLAGRTDLSARQQNRVRKAHEILAAGNAQDAADRNRSQESYLEASRVAAEKKFKDEEVENYMSLVNKETRNGDDETKLYELFDKAVNSGNESMAVAIARIAGRRADTARRFANEKFSNNSAMEGHQDLFRTVAKEMATGANSGNYRQSSPFDFEYASQINKNGYKNTGKYSTWRGSGGTKGGIHDALSNHVSKTTDLMSIKKGALEDIAKAMHGNEMQLADKQKLQAMANSILRDKATGRDNGTFDYDKAAVIQQIADWREPRDGVDIVHNSQ